MIAGIKVNGKFQKITYKIKRCICAPHRLLTKFNPRGLGFVFFCIKGEKNGFAVLTNKQVRTILELVLTHQKTKTEVAKDFGVSFAAIKAIRSGRNWLSVTKDIFAKYGIQK